MLIISPELPKSYRFKVKSNYHRGYTAVFLQRKWLGLFWVNVDYHFPIWSDRADSIHNTMHKLIDEHLNPKSNRFDGYYPPRKEIGT